MRYSDFTLEKIEEQFGIKNQIARLFNDVVAIEPSDWLLNSLAIAKELPIRSEKSKSEWIVVPILSELRNRHNKFFTIYSGDTLNVDKKRGLNGECDFILAKDINSFSINYPIIQIVEAKKNDIELGIPQCAAQMVGAKFFNEKKGIQMPYIYGCVTTGNEWLFLKLSDTILIDTEIFYLNDLPRLLGTFEEIITDYKTLLK